jgi:2-polyprenyl-3-methyl-5-hydroxy-6-metoxy-1,4-benzoquinol methylase/site-specific DNA-cytosine methylase
LPKGATPGRGKPREDREYDQTALRPDDTTQVHRDYGAHFFRWGHAHRFCKGKRVLDLGCGPDHMLGRVLVEHGNMGIRPELYVGADLSELPRKETKHIRLRGGVDLTRDYQRLLDEFGPFDVVTSFEVLEHMPVDAGRRYLTAALRCLKADGVFLLSTPRNEGHTPARNHIHEYSTKELLAAVLEAGFQVEHRYGTFGDVVKLRQAATGTPYEAASRDLTRYYSDDVISCFLAPLFPDACKNNLWVLRPGADAPRPAPEPEELEILEPDAETCPIEDDEDYVQTEKAEIELKAHLDKYDFRVDDKFGEKFLKAKSADDTVRGLPPVVCINTYAGSLLLGAKQLGIDVEMSLEDCGYGQEWSKKNFPRTRHVATRTAWPEDADLRGAVVIAHPPCAAFSIQAKGTVVKSGKYGLQSGHFDETRSVIKYALSHGALALAVESVPLALEGARSEHDALAEEHGYHVFRLQQNAATFNVPQWRPRFWCVFSKSPRFAAWHTPTVVTLAEVLDGVDPGPPDVELDRRLVRQREVLAEQGWDAEKLLSEPGMLVRNIQKHYLPGESLSEIAGKYAIGSSEGGKVGGPIRVGYKFISKTPRVLDPKGTAGVIIGDSWYVYRGKALTPAEYRAVMGFPRDYVLDQKYRTWLSKGVVPAVAAWVLGLMRSNAVGDVPPGAKWLASGETADFKVSREIWQKLADGQRVSDPFGHGGNFVDPHLFRRPAAVSKLGPDAVVVVPSPAAITVSAVTAQFPEFDAVNRAKRKRRVESAYVLTRPATALRGEELEEAFASARAVVPPLASYAFSDAYTVGLVAQYEPPNAGGSKSDVDRIVARAAKKLGAEWRRA